MNDWLHCNKCSLRYNPNMKLFVTECGHLLCERCTGNMKESTCIICKKPTSIIAFAKDMDFKIQQFFTPLEMLLKNILEISDFQMKHRTRLFQAITQKYDYAKRECISCRNKNTDLTRENKMLKSMLMVKRLGQKPQPFLTSTPGFTLDNSQTDMSTMSSIRFTPKNVPVPGYGQRVMPSNSRQVRGPAYQSNFYGGGLSTGPSPAQMVPNMNHMGRPLNVAPIHKPPGTASSMEQLRRVRKRT